MRAAARVGGWRMAARGVVRALDWSAVVACSATLPWAVARGVREVARRGATQRAMLERLPASARARRFFTRRRMLMDAVRVEQERLAWMCRDRFARGYWRRRVSWSGWEVLEGAQRAGRPVVLAVVHYGALERLGRWLCARGVRVGSLVDDTRWISAWRRRGRSGRRLAPRIFRHDQVRRVYRFLERGGVLIAAVDFPRGKMVRLAVEDRWIELSTGPIRLAAGAGALVVPCIAAGRWWWRGRVWIGEPVPEALVMDRSRHGEACRAVLEWAMRVIAADPLQTGELLLRRFEAGEARAAA